MTLPAYGTLAVELQPHSTNGWIATYYPMVTTPAGRWADVTWALHQHLLPATSASLEPARWLQARSPDPDHTCYANWQTWASQLAAGYKTAWAAYDVDTTEESLSFQQAQQLRDATIVVSAGQLSEWLLDDLTEERSDIHG